MTAVTRRCLLAAAGAFSVARQLLASTVSKARLGASPSAFNQRIRAARESHQAFDLIDHCHSLGLRGVEAALPSNPTPEIVANMRRRVETYQMVLVLNTPLPKDATDVDRFDTAVAACKEAGASALHAAMTQRRYEQFDSVQAFQANFAHCRESVALAEPVLRKHRLPLAIENHKGWRAAEQAAWMKQVSSEWVGVCLDMGNNLALCEMPDDTFDALTPFAVFSHFKDMGLVEYPEGFLLAEVPLGTGVIDLPARIAQLRRKNPSMLFCLEMITRDPLKIPVFTDRYWATFSGPEGNISGQDLARMLNLVRKNHPRQPLPQTSGLTTAQAVAAEDGYNEACIRYARQNLEM